MVRLYTSNLKCRTEFIGNTLNVEIEIRKLIVLGKYWEGIKMGGSRPASPSTLSHDTNHNRTVMDFDLEELVNVEQTYANVIQHSQNLHSYLEIGFTIQATAMVSRMAVSMA